MTREFTNESLKKIAKRLEIKEIAFEDIKEINNIQKIAYKASFDKYKFCPIYEATDDQVVSFLKGAMGYKILLDKVIIGSIFICKINDNHYEMNTISINPQFQNTGIGSNAITQVENIHSNVLVWTLSTPDADDRNRHFYEKLGYNQIGSEVINENLTLIEYRKTKPCDF